MSDTNRASLAADATQLALLTESPPWQTFVRLVGEMRDDALRRFANPDETDQYTHHWRGVWTALGDVLTLPQSVIEEERRERRRAEQPAPTPVHIPRRAMRFHDP